MVLRRGRSVRQCRCLRMGPGWRSVLLGLVRVVCVSLISMARVGCRLVAISMVLRRGRSVRQCRCLRMGRGSQLATPDTMVSPLTPAEFASMALRTVCGLRWAAMSTVELPPSELAGRFHCPPTATCSRSERSDTPPRAAPQRGVFVFFGLRVIVGCRRVVTSRVRRPTIRLDGRWRCLTMAERLRSVRLSMRAVASVRGMFGFSGSRVIGCRSVATSMAKLLVTLRDGRWRCLTMAERLRSVRLPMRAVASKRGMFGFSGSRVMYGCRPLATSMVDMAIPSGGPWRCPVTATQW